jgi:acetoin utilization protein AcuB
MLVKYWMRKDVIPIDVNESMQDAVTRMKENQSALLPVTKNGSLAGVLTDRDLKRASASDATTLDIHELMYLLAKIKVGEIMSKDPITVPPDFTLEETAAVLLKNKISGVPVVDATGSILGVITQMEIFKALMSLSGLERRGVQLAFQVEDQPGNVKEITDIVRQYGGRLVSILTSYERAPAGYRHVYVRAFGIERNQMQKLLDDLRDRAALLYMVDHREGVREEYIDSSRVA